MRYDTVIFEGYTPNLWTAEGRRAVIMPFIGCFYWFSPEIQRRLITISFTIGTLPLRYFDCRLVYDNNTILLRTLFEAQITGLPYLAVQTLNPKIGINRLIHHQRVVRFEMLLDPGINHDATLDELQSSLEKIMPKGAVIEVRPFELNSYNALSWSRRVFSWADFLDEGYDSDKSSRTVSKLRAAFGEMHPSQFIIAARLPHSSNFTRHRQMPYALRYGQKIATEF